MSTAVGIGKQIVSFLKQKSTQKGLVGILTAVGLSVRPDQIEAIVTVGVALIGVIDVFTNEDVDKEKLKEEIRQENRSKTKSGSTKKKSNNNS